VLRVLCPCLQALVGAFKPAYWQALMVVMVLYFARFDASFVSLRAKQVGGGHWGAHTQLSCIPLRRQSCGDRAAAFR
jgi:hypothetical protein